MSGKFGRVALGALFAAGSLMGVFSVAAVNAPAAAAQSSAKANIRVIHASPDAPAVDVYVNGGKALSNLAFKDISPWTALDAGSYDIKVTAAGQTAGVITAKLPLEAGKYYSVVAVGKLANITAKVVEDDLSPLAAGKARLRVVHASPDAPAVDVAAKGGPVLVSNLSFPNASDILTVDSMTADVEVRPAGTTTVALAVPGLSLEAGKVYTVYAVGLLTGTPALGVLPVVDSANAADMTGSTAGMPATGAGDSASLLAAAGILLLAFSLVTGGAAIRVRNR